MTQPSTERQMAAAPAGERDDDRAAIERTALDYVQGWYEGDAERMGRALHPELAKRAYRPDPQTGEPRFRHATREQMVEATRRGGGSDTPASQRTYTVTVQDVYGEIASARVESFKYVDYLHLARVAGVWQIVNVLWAATPNLRQVLPDR